MTSTMGSDALLPFRNNRNNLYFHELYTGEIMEKLSIYFSDGACTLIEKIKTKVRHVLSYFSFICRDKGNAG